jgi:hypothetical protein
MGEERKIRFKGEELGTFSIRQVMRMTETGEINHTAEYWSEKGQKWRLLPSFIWDFYDGPDRLSQMQSSGITKTKVLGVDASDCPACMALQKKTYSIEKMPTLPPTDCTCVPWCRCTVIAIE